MLTLTYPKRQSIAFSNTLFRLYEKAIKAQDDEIRFDLGKSESLTPFAIIMLTSTISECLGLGKKCRYIAPENRKLRQFFNDIGFDNYFGLGGQNRKPSKIDTQRIQLRKLSGLNPLIIEHITDMLESHLSISQGLRGALHMSILETMTNVVDHSGVDNYYVCAYYDQRKKQIRLCIADTGIGIPLSLRRTENYRTIDSDYEAIKISTNEGVTSRPGRAGLGLNHIREFLFVNKGQMCIISGKGKVYWKFDRGETLEQRMKVPFNGTVIKWVINTEKHWFYFMSNEKEYLF